MNSLEQRIIDLSHKYHLSHIGSVLITVNIIDKIFMTKRSADPFILSNGHAGLALYAVLEKYGYGDAEELFLKHGVHPNRDVKHGIHVSTGSLGHGIGIALGMALADTTQVVYVLLSDGECAEGSVWEALRLAGDLRIENLRVAVVANGKSAYGDIDVEDLDKRLVSFYPVMVIKCNLFHLPDWIQGLSGHYVTLDDKKYAEISGKVGFGVSG